MLAEQENTEMLRLLRLLCERSGIDLGKDDGGRAFEEETKHADIIRQIRGEIEGSGEAPDEAEKRVDENGMPAAVS
jgi:hypothetical protein